MPPADASGEVWSAFSVPPADASEVWPVFSVPPADASEVWPVFSVPPADASEVWSVFSAPPADASSEVWSVFSVPHADASSEVWPVFSAAGACVFPADASSEVWLVFSGLVLVGFLLMLAAKYRLWSPVLVLACQLLRLALMCCWRYAGSSVELQGTFLPHQPMCQAGCQAQVCQERLLQRLLAFMLRATETRSKGTVSCMSQPKC